MGRTHHSNHSPQPTPTASPFGISPQEHVRQCETVSSVYAHLAHPVRIQLLCALLDGPHSVTELVTATGLLQPIISQFLSRMKSDGLVSARRDGRRVFYSIRDPIISELLLKTRELFCTDPVKLKKGKKS